MLDILLNVLQDLDNINIKKEQIKHMSHFQQNQAQVGSKNEEQPQLCSLTLIGHEPQHISQQASQQKKNKRSVGATSVNNFIQKTFDILQEKKFENIVSWAENSDSLPSKHFLKSQVSGNQPMKNNGDRVCSFKIHNVKAFEQIVLPQYFKHSNMSSFVRQLNMYNFHKVRGDKNEYEFQHERFVKNRPDLLHEIRRKQIDSTANIPSVSLISYHELAHQLPQHKEFQVQVESELFKAMEERPGISLQEIQSPMKEVDPSIAKPSSNEEFLTYRLAELQEANRNLKKTKQMKANILKQIALNNKTNIASKFNKIVMAIISTKLQQDINEKILPQSEAKYNLNSLHGIVDHIMDSSEFKGFKEYIQMVYPLFDASQIKEETTN